MADSIVEKLIINFSNGPDYLAQVGVLAEEAKTARDEANEAANSAANSANSAANSANKAQEFADKAADSVVFAQQAEDEAKYAASQAKDSADAAAAFANSAQAASNTAVLSAQTAGAQATTAQNAVTQVEGIAAGIIAAAPPAWDADTVYSYPTVVSYTDGNTYRCIGQNVPAGTTPDTSQLWVRTSVLGGDDYFDIDLHGSLMPAINPTFAYNWTLDAEGNIMPRDASDNVVTPINSYAEQALKTANEALAKANTIIYEGIPVELDSQGNVTTTNDTY